MIKKKKAQMGATQPAKPVKKIGESVANAVPLPKSDSTKSAATNLKDIPMLSGPPRKRSGGKVKSKMKCGGKVKAKKK